MEELFASITIDRLLTALRALSFTFVMVGGSVAIGTLLHNARTNRSRFVIDITELFLKDEEVRKFWYRVNYEQWQFDLSNFRGSEEEQNIDTILYRFAIVGQLLRNQSISCRDLVNTYWIVRQFLVNEQIKEYMRFVVLDFWRIARHTDLQWPDAMHLYREQTKYQVKQGFVKRSELDDFDAFIIELKRIPYDEALRKEIAERINYDRPL